MKTKFQFSHVAFVAVLITSLSVQCTFGRPADSNPFGSSLSFDGVNDYVSVTGQVNLANSSFTIEAWANRDSLGREEFFVGQGTTVPSQGLHFGYKSNNKFTFAFWSNDLDTPADLEVKTWHHWAGTYDAATRVRCIYRDGVLVATDTASSPYTGSGYIRIGSVPQVAHFPFKGWLDEVRIWNVVRTPAEIQAQMSQSLAGTETGLVAYYK